MKKILFTSILLVCANNYCMESSEDDKPVDELVNEMGNMTVENDEKLTNSDLNKLSLEDFFNKHSLNYDPSNPSIPDNNDASSEEDESYGSASEEGEFSENENPKLKNPSSGQRQREKSSTEKKHFCSSEEDAEAANAINRGAIAYFRIPQTSFKTRLVNQLRSITPRVDMKPIAWRKKAHLKKKIYHAALKPSTTNASSPAGIGLGAVSLRFKRVSR